MRFFLFHLLHMLHPSLPVALKVQIALLAPIVAVVLRPESPVALLGRAPKLREPSLALRLNLHHLHNRSPFIVVRTGHDPGAANHTVHRLIGVIVELFLRNQVTSFLRRPQEPGTQLVRALPVLLVVRLLVRAGGVEDLE
uniref:(northern house mosquito) hypothetical protein n=1 Tax=Culex pipiens TaxID=7175 RepID=A0A8D8CHE3_CULPI